MGGPKRTWIGYEVICGGGYAMPFWACRIHPGPPPAHPLVTTNPRQLKREIQEQLDLDLYGLLCLGGQSPRLIH